MRRVNGDHPQAVLMEFEIRGHAGGSEDFGRLYRAFINRWSGVLGMLASVQVMPPIVGEASRTATW